MKKKTKKKIKAFFSSYTPIIICLILLVVILIIYNYHLMKSSKTYMFSGASDYVSIYNGVISLNYDVNVFVGSDIDYLLSKDKTVVSYKIGYFLKNGDALVFIEDADEGGYSLKALVEGISTFNVTELTSNDIYFSKDTIKELSKGLDFIIEATTDKGEKINEKVSVELTKVSK